MDREVYDADGGSSAYGAVKILGVGVHRLSMGDLIREATQRAQSGARSTISYANVHVLNIAYRDPELCAVLNRADIVYSDGAGVVLGARLLGHRLPGRMTGADWIESLCEACAAGGVTLYFLGGQPGVAARAAQLLQARHPRLRIAGTHHGYLLHPPPPGLREGGRRGEGTAAVAAINAAQLLQARHPRLRIAGTHHGYLLHPPPPGLGEGGRGGEGTAAVAAINATCPHILLVGMGTPTQEKWIAAHRAELHVPIVWAVGALFDFVVGVQPRGPRWMLDHGLEWLCRLLSDPARLWRRYLLGNPLFILRVLRQRCAR